ncbi:Stealth CR1 domain-containing protein [Kitasatospora sp. NPDC056327]|uniref:Stealth CR1 domain-containing protein n=1 Tax=Kitasatospora sp. NPDC056327 TaxID=3345785 RepID=UPI0035DDCD4B
MPIRPANLAARMRPLTALARRARPTGDPASGPAADASGEPVPAPQEAALPQDGRREEAGRSGEPATTGPATGETGPDAQDRASAHEGAGSPEEQDAPQAPQDREPPYEQLSRERSALEEELLGSLTDVVRHGGHLAETHRTLLPADRRDGNLAEVADALRAAGVAHGIVPDRHPRHRLAISPGDRPAVLRALAAAFAGRAVYADLLEHGRTLATVLAEQLPDAVALLEPGPGDPEDAPADHVEGQEQSGPIWPADRVKGVRIYRPAVIGTLLYGADTGCDLEFWDSAAPSPGAIAAIDETPFGWWLPSLEATATTTVGDRSYPLLDAFAASLPDQVDFPVDAVITWVDDSDPAWQERRAAARARLAHTAAPIAEEDGVAESGIAGDADQRFRNRDELRYCLRALAAHAPWIRRVHLVTDDQSPDWLDTAHPGLSVVAHRELFAGTDAGPVFNSHAIETRLHLVPGLAEHFLYLNDDVFLGRPLVPEDFFLGNGMPRYFPDDRIVPPGAAGPDDSVYVAAQKNTRAALAAAVGKTYPRTLKHSPHPLLRSVLAETAERFGAELHDTVRSPFRAAADLAPVTLAVHYAHATARTVEGHLYDGYFVTDSTEDLGRLAQLHEERWADYFCLADGTRDLLSPEQQEEAVTAFLRTYFPVPSPFETVEPVGNVPGPGAGPDAGAGTGVGPADGTGSTGVGPADGTGSTGASGGAEASGSAPEATDHA